ncbi:hypothetical protein K503DRAFT_798678 [Rhizopogon vinicolor AM-OR11-026]|uniref:Uncharacterized protein n=1 Tax=Rhizopogon vinicolor AM-OR11-026 TaxID=1314800 RepID=A0A1B7N6Z9_9AGAM|nr:hypothetical protein K503DRAFT_798678 [Rhizopogon vinicolor AM-OR11-026]
MFNIVNSAFSAVATVFQMIVSYMIIALCFIGLMLIDLIDEVSLQVSPASEKVVCSCVTDCPHTEAREELLVAPADIDEVELGRRYVESTDDSDVSRSFEFDVSTFSTFESLLSSSPSFIELGSAPWAELDTLECVTSSPHSPTTTMDAADISRSFELDASVVGTFEFLLSSSPSFIELGSAPCDELDTPRCVTSWMDGADISRSFELNASVVGTFEFLLSSSPSFIELGSAPCDELDTPRCVAFPMDDANISRSFELNASMVGTFESLLSSSPSFIELGSVPCDELDTPQCVASSVDDADISQSFELDASSLGAFESLLPSSPSFLELGSAPSVELDTPECVSSSPYLPTTTTMDDNTSVSLSMFDVDRFPTLISSSTSFVALGEASCSYYLDTSHHVTSSAPSPNSSVSLSVFDLERFPSLICPSSSFRALASASRRSSTASSFSLSTSINDADVTISLSSSFSKYPSLLSSSPSFIALGSVLS